MAVKSPPKVDTVAKDKARAKSEALQWYTQAVSNKSSQDAQYFKEGLIEYLSTDKLDQPTSDFIWKVLISSIAIVFVGTALAVAAGIFMSKTADALLPLITIFTTTVGILAPSPFQKSQTTTNGQNSAGKAG